MARLVRRTVCGYRTRRRIEERSDGIFEQIHRLCSGYVSTACAANDLKVTIIGAGGKIGRSLALCLKQSTLIDELAVYDACPIAGLILDLSHVNSKCKTIRYGDTDNGTGVLALERALHNAKIVAIVSEKKNLCEEATDVQKLVPSLLKHCPKAFVALVSRSINSLLPMLFELYKKEGVFECNRLFGVMNLYSTRANTFAAETLNIDPEFVSVPVIGGGTTETCLPLFSQTRPCSEFTSEELARLTEAMKSADALVTEAYGSDRVAESSVLCAGFAAARFCISLCKALRDECGIVECAYARSCLMPQLKYFGAPLELGPCGIQKHLGVPGLTNRECKALYEALPEIKRAIELGESLALGLKASTEFCPVPVRCTALELYQSNVTV